MADKTRNYKESEGSNNVPSIFRNKPNVFEQAVHLRQHLMQQRREFNKKMLRTKYPVKYACLHGVVVGLLAIAAIVIQIIVIINKANLYYVGSGLWVGVYFLVCANFTLLIIRKRSYRLFVTTLVLHYFGIMISIGGMIIVNVFGSTTTSCLLSFSTCTFTSNLYNIVLIALGAALVLCSVVFIITMQCLLNGFNGLYLRNRRRQLPGRVKLNPRINLAYVGHPD